jgi:hypothetical protein
VSPTGGNANNINAAYYQSFNIENRYINFAVNLGKLGEGAARFQAQYGALTLSESLVKAYTELFGAAPDAAKTASLLNDQVPNGAGGTYTRAEYFAFYGRDGANGIGTKAAMVGWLMAQAAKEDVGTYAKANDALLKGVAVDGIAKFHSDLVATYGPPPPPDPGAIINSDDFAFYPGVATIGSRTTEADDTVRVTQGLPAVGRLLAVGGNDTLTVIGVMSGLIDSGAGNDVITVDTLDSPVAILGYPINGAILGGDGNDTIKVNTEARSGSTIDGGAGDDTATITGNTNTNVTIRGVEHIISRVGTFDFTGVTGVLDFWSEGGGTLKNVPNGATVGFRNTQPGVTIAEANFVAGTTAAEVHIANFQGYPFNHVSFSGMLGIIDPLNLNIFNVTGTATLVVDSNSSFGQVWQADGDTLVIKGVGTMNAAVMIGRLGAFEKLDASAAAQVNISYYAPRNAQAVVALSGGDDSILVVLGQDSNTSFTLGGGSDYFSFRTFGPNSNPWANLHITGTTIDRFATITDFQKGVDHIDLGTSYPSVQVDLTQYIQAPPNLESALVAVSSHLSANGTGLFVWNGDSYLYHQDATVGVNSGDGLIKLVGVTGLTVATGAAVGDIHYG